jgi:hypothetical protein
MSIFLVLRVHAESQRAECKNAVPKGINITNKSSPTHPPQGIVLAPPDSPPQALGDERTELFPLVRLG